MNMNTFNFPPVCSLRDVDGPQPDDEASEQNDLTPPEKAQFLGDDDCASNSQNNAAARLPSEPAPAHNSGVNLSA